MKKDLKPHKMLRDENVRTLMYDHTFAFPRLIWYLALICLMVMNYSFTMIAYSTAFLFLLYIIVGYLYYIAINGFLFSFRAFRSADAEA